MNQAESIVAEMIELAFNGVASNRESYSFDTWNEIPDSWIAANEDIIAYYSHPDESFLLPAFLCYLLKNEKDNPETLIYINIANTLTEYSKEKSKNCFKNTMTKNQFYAIKAFIKHFTHNKSVNIDRTQWEKILSNWTRNERYSKSVLPTGVMTEYERSY